jgi:hypothetical protein
MESGFKIIKRYGLLVAFCLVTARADGASIGPCAPFVKKYCPDVKMLSQLVDCVTVPQRRAPVECVEFVYKQKETITRAQERRRATGSKVGAQEKSEGGSSAESPGNRTLNPHKDHGMSDKGGQRFEKSRRNQQIEGRGIFHLIAAVLLGFNGFSLCFVFRKMGLKPWAALIPIYNMYLLLRELDRPESWNYLVWIPLVGFYYLYLVVIDIARRFNRSDGFGIGLLLLPFVFLAILAFGPDTYHSDFGKEATDFGPDFDLKELSRIMEARKKEDQIRQSRSS